MCWEHRKMLNNEIYVAFLMSHTLCVTTVKMHLHKKITHPGIATNTLVLYGPVPGVFANSVISLDDTELAKCNGQQYKGGFEIRNGIHPTFTKKKKHRNIRAKTNSCTCKP